MQVRDRIILQLCDPSGKPLLPICLTELMCILERDYNQKLTLEQSDESYVIATNPIF